MAIQQEQKTQMHFSKVLCALAVGALVSGCATIIESTAQDVAINTTPPGARCDVSRNGTHVGTVAPTPGVLRLDKSKNDLTITCAKDLYAESKSSQPPRFVGTTFLNLIIGGVVGFIVDASTGANFKYSEKVDIVLAPIDPRVPVAVQPNAVPSPMQLKPVS